MWRSLSLSLSLPVLLVCGSVAAASQPSRVVIDWSALPQGSIELNHASAAPATNGWLTLRTLKGSGRVGLKARLPREATNLQSFAEIAVPVINTGSNDLRIILRVDDPSTEPLPTTQTRKCIFQTILSPGPEPVWLVVPIGGDAVSPLEGKFISMVGQPVDFVRRGAVKASSVSAISVFMPDPDEEHSFSLGPVAARGVPAPFREWSSDKAFPIVDAFGQYVHRTWPTKIHSPGDFGRQKVFERASLATNARPSEWNQYGGWNKGPRLKASGFFRVQKAKGAWWMVDPEGRLFWSHGVVRVGTRIRVGSEYRGTPLPDREHFFSLPERSSPFGVFYGTEPQSTRRYYVGRDNHAVFDFLEANLFRKYGDEWRSGYAVQAQWRLASWGLNTIANSSDPEIFLKRQTPYTAIVYSAPLGRSEFRLQGSAGNWGKLPDPFDPGWRKLMDDTLRTELKDSLNDPWCLGFFVDNELHWGESNYVAEATLISPGNQPAKKALVLRLKAKYGEIASLNSAWKTQLESWDAFLASTNLPNTSVGAVRTDLSEFNEAYVDAYFRGCREAIKAAAPNHMYLGCRFAQLAGPLVMKVAARYCDIISINRYANTVADLGLGKGLDKPIIIGEFHFTAMDAPMQPSGLVLVANQKDRARAYATYVQSALKNPAVVGTHWFQYYDQPTTGRFDAENYQTGLLDICDTPYVEMVEACRKIGRNLYAIRAGAHKASVSK